MLKIRPLKPFSLIASSFTKSLKGEEKLSIIFFAWGVIALTILQYAVGEVSFYVEHNYTVILGHIFNSTREVDLVMSFICPVLFSLQVFYPVFLLFIITNCKTYSGNRVVLAIMKIFLVLISAFFVFLLSLIPFTTLLLITFLTPFFILLFHSDDRLVLISIKILLIIILIVIGFFFFVSGSESIFMGELALLEKFSDKENLLADKSFLYYLAGRLVWLFALLFIFVKCSKVALFADETYKKLYKSSKISFFYEVCKRNKVKFIIFVPLTIWLSVIEYENFSGYCREEGKHYSNQELIDITILKHFVVEDDEVREKLMGESCEEYLEEINSHEYDKADCNNKYFYNSLEEFYKNNPNCCKVSEFADKESIDRISDDRIFNPRQFFNILVGYRVKNIIIDHITKFSYQRTKVVIGACNIKKKISGRFDTNVRYEMFRLNMIIN